MDEIQEIKDLLLQYIRGIWRNRWIALIVAWPLMLGGVLTVDQIKDRYVAETKVYLDSTTILKPLLEGLAIQTDFQSIVNLMVRKLLSRPNLERAVRLLDMDIDVQTPEDMERLIRSVRDKIDISASNRSGVYTISYTSTDRAQAKAMVQVLLDIFVEDTLGKSVTESDSAISFLDQQIQKYDQLLQEAEERREAFKRKNVGLMPRDGATYYSQLQQVNGELEAIVIALNESQSRRDKLQTRLSDFVASQASAEPIITDNAYDAKIEEQESRLNDLLLLYTDEHPDVINTRRVLKALEERKAEELAKPAVTANLDVAGNPVYQELEILLATTEADISSLLARKSSFENNREELTKLVEIVPKIEAELQRLNRDYDVHKSNYTELVKRRETARISEDVESGTEQVKFRIIEPPFVPVNPDFPNRLLLDLVVLVFALGAGYALSLLISLIQPVFYSPSDLKRLTNYTVLGSVPQFGTANVVSNRMKNIITFAGMKMLLVATLLGLAIAHHKGVTIVGTMKSLVV